MKESNYVGQAWVNGIGDGLNAAYGLRLIAHDLLEVSRDREISGPLELWSNDQRDTKGLFMGDTSSLPDEGWEFVATLF